MMHYQSMWMNLWDQLFQVQQLEWTGVKSERPHTFIEDCGCKIFVQWKPNENCGGWGVFPQCHPFKDVKEEITENKFILKLIELASKSNKFLKISFVNYFKMLIWKNKHNCNIASKINYNIESI